MNPSHSRMLDKGDKASKPLIYIYMYIYNTPTTAPNRVWFVDQLNRIEFAAFLLACAADLKVLATIAPPFAAANKSRKVYTAPLRAQRFRPQVVFNRGRNKAYSDPCKSELVGPTLKEHSSPFWCLFSSTSPGEWRAPPVFAVHPWKSTPPPPRNTGRLSCFRLTWPHEGNKPQLALIIPRPCQSGCPSCQLRRLSRRDTPGSSSGLFGEGCKHSLLPHEELNTKQKTSSPSSSFF